MSALGTSPEPMLTLWPVLLLLAVSGSVAIQQLGSVSMFVAHFTKGHVDVPGLACCLNHLKFQYWLQHLEEQTLGE